ncbi:MAG: protein O-GlcNAc transferase [Betaproteobacteria bacterium]|jgi:predicted O-linked N-acetylglucosamine transferase (SPINDLY family)|nr:protein O-GlcNAc transferase [Betaproteobacteria bacterium]
MLSSVLKQLFQKMPGRGHSDSSWLERATALHRDGCLDEAAAVCRARLTVNPADVQALEALAAALLAQGRSSEGLACLRQALEHAPENAELHATLGLVYSATGQIDAALESYRRATTLQPGLGDAWIRLAGLLKTTARYDEAEDCCRHAMAAIGATSTLRHALAEVLFEQGRVAESINELRAALALDANAPEIHSDLLRALNYVGGLEPAAVFGEHRAWGLRHAAALEDPEPHQNTRTPDRRLRIGYVSPYFRKHAVTFFLESVIEHYDRTAFEVVLYADVARPDEYSERLKGYGAAWCSTVGLSNEALARKIRSDGVDILVDLSGHTPSNRLLAFARRPAPVQVTWNGYPNTTGVPAIGYRITDSYCDPPGLTDSLHTEHLSRLPGIYMSWRPPADAPAVNPLPVLSSGRVTFGSFNSCFKITTSMIELWSRVLHAVPDSRLVLFTITGERATQRLRDAFALHGVRPERVEVRGRVSHEAFLAAHGEIDIAFDTFPYHGTTTTCFSLWMGVPVVTLAGAVHVSRVGVSLLNVVRLPQLVATSSAQYVQIASDLASNLDALAHLRAELRGLVRNSPLVDGRACAKNLEKAFTAMWRTWCSARSPGVGD